MKRDRLAAMASIILGLGIAANALMGPLALGIIRFRQSANMENQLLGGELASLFLAAPMAIAGGVLWWRGHSLAPMVAIGPAGFALYNYIQFVLVPDYTRYEGNNEYFFPLYLALIILGWSIVWRAWRQLSAQAIVPLRQRVARVLGGMFGLLSGTFAVAWLGSIATQLTGNRTADYAEHPTAFWLIRLMDLGFVIPLGLLAGVGLLRRGPGASRIACAFIGTQTLLACAVAGMAIRMWARDDAGVTPALLVVSTGGAAVFAVLYVLVLRSALGKRTTPEQRRDFSHAA